MFDIHGDQITFRGVHFATIDGKAWPTLRDEASARITEECPPGFVPEKDALDNWDDGYSDGLRDGAAEGERKARKDLESEMAKAMAESRAAGYDAGIAFGERAADARRVHDILSAMTRAESILRAPLNGVKEEGRYLPRPAKISELKREMQMAIGELKMAMVKFRSEG